ncbi:MAG: AsmA family protein, partial [Pseudomonadota bacterium]
MKRLGIGLTGLACLMVVVVVAAPLVMSSETVKARIEAQLSDVTGRRVRLAGDSSVSINPYLGVTYFDVTIGQAQGQAGAQGEAAPLVTIEEMRAQLGFLALLRGEITLSRLTL